MFLSQSNYVSAFVIRNSIKKLKENVLNIFRNWYYFYLFVNKLLLNIQIIIELFTLKCRRPIHTTKNVDKIYYSKYQTDSEFNYL